MNHETNTGIPTYDQAWSVISDIAKACREFNTLQFQYRQLALTLILAAYAAMGYFIINETPAKGSNALETTVPAKQGVSADAASVSTGRGPVITLATHPPATPNLVVVRTQNTNATQTESRSARFRRVSLLLLGIGLLSSFATLSIWFIDVGVYHRLLRANFDVGKGFEIQLEGLLKVPPPLISIKMSNSISATRAAIMMCLFYALGVLAGPMPWAIHTWMSSADSAGDAWNTRRAAVVAIAAVALLSVLVSLLLVPRQEAASSRPTSSRTARPADSGASIKREFAGANELFHAAKAARENAYAEYSRFRVGAAVLALEGGNFRVFSGCNVENAASGETLCAERNAIAAAVAAGCPDIRELLVYGDDTAATPPCGSCRSVLHEFNADALVHLAIETGVCETFELRELYPHPFGPESLGKR